MHSLDCPFNFPWWFLPHPQFVRNWEFAKPDSCCLIREYIWPGCDWGGLSNSPPLFGGDLCPVDAGRGARTDIDGCRNGRCDETANRQNQNSLQKAPRAAEPRAALTSAIVIATHRTGPICRIAWFTPEPTASRSLGRL